MADTLSMELLELLRKGEVEDKAGFLGEAVRRMAQAIIEAEVEQVIGAGRYERSEARTNQRNGSVPRRWDTAAGTIDLAIPKLRQGSFFPTLLERRRRVDQALVNVVVEAYVQGVSTRKVDNLVQALGVQGMDKSTVSRLAKELDEQVTEFRERSLGTYPYVWLDATFPKVREGGRVRQMALMIAIGVNGEGERHILGLAMGVSENGADWLEFLQRLKDRGLCGVQLVISDNHFGLRSAVERAFLGASWQRCTVHFTRNVVQKVPKASQTAVSAVVRQIFAQPDRASADAQLAVVATNLMSRFPEVSQMLYDAHQDILAHMHFPQAHWRQIRSTNGLERLNREIARRIDVVGIFPTRDSVIRLTGAVLMEQDDEWSTSRRYFSVESMQVLAQAPAPASTFLKAAREQPRLPESAA